MSTERAVRAQPQETDRRRADSGLLDWALPVAFLSAVAWGARAGWQAFSERLAARREAAGSWTRAEEIDHLYRELHQLRAQPGLPAGIEGKLARLRELQREEAALMRERFEASLTLPSGAGLAALRQARQLLGRDEDPASPDPASA